LIFGFRELERLLEQRLDAMPVLRGHGGCANDTVHSQNCDIGVQRSRAHRNVAAGVVTSDWRS
jgi:hypothetical protein